MMSHTALALTALRTTAGEPGSRSLPLLARAFYSAQAVSAAPAGPAMSTASAPAGSHAPLFPQHPFLQQRAQPQHQPDQRGVSYAMPTLGNPIKRARNVVWRPKGSHAVSPFEVHAAEESVCDEANGDPANQACA